jgi:hypothetical protein
VTPRLSLRNKAGRDGLQEHYRAARETCKSKSKSKSRSMSKRKSESKSNSKRKSKSK